MIKPDAEGVTDHSSFLLLLMDRPSMDSSSPKMSQVTVTSWRCPLAVTVKPKSILV